MIEKHPRDIILICLAITIVMIFVWIFSWQLLQFIDWLIVMPIVYSAKAISYVIKIIYLDKNNNFHPRFISGIFIFEYLELFPSSTILKI